MTNVDGSGVALAFAIGPLSNVLLVMVTSASPLLVITTEMAAHQVRGTINGCGALDVTTGVSR